MHCGAHVSPGESKPATFPSANSRTDARALVPPKLATRMHSAATKHSGERREVTVLFLDSVDFTSASRELDNEDVYLVIDEVMRLSAEVIFKYEGTIDKFTGDGLMALFGAPIAHENDPERAVRAALKYRRCSGHSAHVRVTVMVLIFRLASASILVLSLQDAWATTCTWNTLSLATRSI